MGAGAGVVAVVVVVMVAVRRGLRGMRPRLNGCVNLGLEIAVQPGWKTRLGPGGGVYVSFLVREEGTRHCSSVGAGLRGCRRLLGEGWRTFFGWVVLWLRIPVGSTKRRAVLCCKGMRLLLFGCLGRGLDVRLSQG